MNKTKPGIISISLIFIILFGSTSLVCLWTLRRYKELKIDLSKVDSYQGRVTKKGTTYYMPDYYVSYMVEYIGLEGQTQKFATDEPGIIDKINVDDVLTIYYKKSDETLNFTIYQLEKGKSIIKSKEEFESSGKTSFITGLIGSTMMLVILIWSIIKIRFNTLAD